MSFFSEREVACPCCGLQDMDSQFMVKLNLLRNNYGHPLYLSSAYRCPEYNAKLGGRAGHPSGKAVDIAIIGHDALQLVGLAISLGFTGVGIKQHGSDRFVHLDTLELGEADGSPRPWLWSYS